MTAIKIDDDNVYIKQLNKIFLECANNEETSLDRNGLCKLCAKLNLLSYVDLIIGRVLNGYNVVDFKSFKEQFLKLLPEVISVDSYDAELENEAEKYLIQYGLDVSSLTRSDMRNVCENTKRLNRLDVIDINDLFDQADSSGTGRVTLTQFLNQFLVRNRLDGEVNFISDAYVPSVNIFKAIDMENTGIIEVNKLLEHWAACGISFEQSFAVLKELSIQGSVNTIILSGKLERELSEMATSSRSSTIVRVALLSLHSYIDHLRYLSKESESRCEHLNKQLQLVNQRRNLLIDELEQNQISIEESYEQRIKDCEDRFRVRLHQIEERLVTEKRELVKEAETMEEEISRLRYNEVTCRTRLQLIEKQYARMSEETREMAETIQKLEQSNRQLRADLGKSMQAQHIEENLPTVVWRRRIELLMSHNKTLRERIEELSKVDKKCSTSKNRVNPLYFCWTNSFRIKVMTLRKRRLAQMNDSFPEMDSEPEAIFAHARKRRLLKVRDRLKIHRRIEESVSSSHTKIKQSSSEESVNSSLLQRNTSYNSQIKSTVLKKLKDQHRGEISALNLSASKALNAALCKQRRQITLSFDQERQQFEIRLSSERNALERRFAEEKMKLISQLQEEFNVELNRLKTLFSPNVSDDCRSIPMHICARTMLVSKPMNVCYENVSEQNGESSIGSSDSKQIVLPPNSTYISLIEKYRKHDPLASSNCDFREFSDSQKILNTRTQLTSLSSNVDRAHATLVEKCRNCEIIADCINEFLSIFNGGKCVAESGFEDVNSSSDSLKEDVTSIKNENKELKNRLDLLRKWAFDTFACISSTSKISGDVGYAETNQIEHHVLGEELTENGDEVEMLRKKIAVLGARNALFNARVVESKEVIKYLTVKYAETLKEIFRVNRIFQNACFVKDPRL